MSEEIRRELVVVVSGLVTRGMERRETRVYSGSEEETNGWGIAQIKEWGRQTVKKKEDKV